MMIKSTQEQPLWLLLLTAVYLAFSAANSVAADEVAPETIIERGPHHRIIETLTPQLNYFGKANYHTNRVIALGGGMNYWDAGTGQWLETRELFELFEGGAIARQGQTQVILSPNANSPGAVDVLTSEGVRLKSHVLGLALRDAVSGQSVLIAELTDSIGELSSPNQVLYRGALTGDGIVADLRYTYTRMGIEQDIIIRRWPQNATPADWNLPVATCRMEVLTEMLQAPAPAKESMVIKSQLDSALRQAMGSPDLVDETLHFGSTMIGSGRAFPLEQPVDLFNEITEPILTAKSWVQLEGRTFLVESVEWLAIELHVKTLPQGAAIKQKPNGVFARATAPSKVPTLSRQFPSAPTKRASGNVSIRTASLKSPSSRSSDSSRVVQVPSISLPEDRGLVLDYSTMTTASNFLFKGDTTYYVESAVTLNGTTTFEGGSVIKSTNANTTASRLTIAGPVVCLGAAGRPIIFTGKDDNTVGEIITGSTGNAGTNYYGKYIDLTGNINPVDLHHIFFRHAYYAINMGANYLTLSHAQFNSNYVALFHSTGHAWLRNVLVSDGSFAFATGGTNRCENVTFHRLGALRSSTYTNGWFTNTLILSVTNYVYFNGGSDVITNLDDTGFFQTVGSGSHYLAAGSTNRNAGTTNINSTLANDLRNYTTYPPVLLSNAITTDTLLSPQAQRDTDLPDLGYHYDPIDFIGLGMKITNATLRLTNGVTLALDVGSATFGLQLQSGSQLLSDGLATSLNRILRTHCIQENCTSTNTTSPTLSDANLPTVRPIIRLNFTELPSLSSTRLIKQLHAEGGLSLLTLRDCQLGGGRIDISNNTSNQHLFFTNNIFDRVQLVIFPYMTHNIYTANNLFREGSVDLQSQPSGSYTWSFYNNFFDRTTLSQYSPLTLTHDYNGYITNTTRLTGGGGGTHDVLVDEPNYQTGSLGRFYLTNTSTLINTGSVLNASTVGFYHYTTTTNQVKEGTNRLDISFHYVATTNGIPIDTDGDGLADYLEDSDGNGLKAATESSWAAADTDGDGVNDYDEVAQGRNPNLSGWQPDLGYIKLRTLIPRK